MHDLGLWDDIIPISKTHPAAASRFLLDPSSSSKSLVRLPSSLLSVIKPQHPMLKGLLLSASTEPFRHRRSPSGAADEIADESVDSFFRRRFGARIADNLASAMVHGIYAADSRRLSMRSAFPSLWDAEEDKGSVLLGSMFGKGKSEVEKRDWEELDRLGLRKEAESWSIYGLRCGTGTLTNALHAGFMGKQSGQAGTREIKAGHRVDGLRPDGESIQVNLARSLSRAGGMKRLMCLGFGRRIQHINRPRHLSPSRVSRIQPHTTLHPRSRQNTVHHRRRSQSRVPASTHRHSSSRFRLPRTALRTLSKPARHLGGHIRQYCSTRKRHPFAQWANSKIDRNDGWSLVVVLR